MPALVARVLPFISSHIRQALRYRLSKKLNGLKARYLAGVHP
jgi:hypothetical protein